MKQAEKKKNQNHIFHSIRLKLTMTLVGVMGVWMFITWLVCMLFLETFYMSKIQQTLKDSYNTINDMVGESDAVGDILSQQFYTDSNIDVVIGYFLDDSNVVVDYSTSSEGYMGRASMEKLFQLAVNVKSSDSSEWKLPDAQEYDKGFYIIQKNHDTRTSSTYLDLIGTLDNGHVIVIQTPVESIRKSAMISNTFLGYTGMMVTLFGCIFMFFISSNYSRPIQQMALIAKRMSKTQVDEMRKEFLSHVSHELKTPIALIQGYAEGLKDNILEDEESKEFYCDVIIDEAAKMNGMVKRLLALNECRATVGYTDSEI